MQFDRAKLGAVILYSCRKCPPDRLGAVKLNKVLYFFDMLRFVEAGVPATGATYRKRPHGPTCVQMLSALAQLERDSSLATKTVEYHGYRKTEYIALADAEMARFNAEEIGLLDDVIDFVCMHNSARTISEFSHQRPWESVEFGDEIPYESAFLLYPSQVTPEAFARVEQGAAEIEAARSNADTLDFGTFAALRTKVLSAR